MTGHTELNVVQQTSLESAEETQAKNSANALNVQHATPNANTMLTSTKTVTRENTKENKTTALKK